jgi:hypothetical protein
LWCEPDNKNGGLEYARPQLIFSRGASLSVEGVDSWLNPNTAMLPCITTGHSFGRLVKMQREFDIVLILYLFQGLFQSFPAIKHSILCARLARLALLGSILPILDHERHDTISWQGSKSIYNINPSIRANWMAWMDAAHAMCGLLDQALDPASVNQQLAMKDVVPPRVTAEPSSLPFWVRGFQTLELGRISKHRDWKSQYTNAHASGWPRSGSLHLV